MKKEKSKKNSKYSLLKVLGISFLIFAILTWIVPAGSFSGATYSEYSDQTMPVGLFGLFINPLYSFGIFAQYFLLFLSIGGLYGILNKTGVYGRLVEKISKKVVKHKGLAIIIIAFLFALISALFGNQIVLFLLVPFALAILINAGFSKVTSLATTVGSIIVGVAGSIFGNDVIAVSFFGEEPFNGTLMKVIFFAIITVLYILFLLYQSGLLKKKNKKSVTENLETTKEEVIPLYEKAESKKSLVPLVIMLIILLVLVLVGCLNWDYTFGVSYFTDLDSKISEIGWLSKLFGFLPVIGYFGNYDVAAIILLFTFLIKWIYSIKFDEFIDGFVDGVKQMIKPAVYSIFASIIFAFMVNNNYNISTTISNSILGINDKFYVLTMTLLGFVGGYFFNDLPYLINSIYGAVDTYGVTNVPVMMILLQTGYSIAMLCLPVSVVLIAGLKYLNVSYKEWMKYIYKFLLLMFVLVIVFGLIVLSI